MYALKIDYTKCDYCLECVDICSAEALTYDGDEFNFQSDLCTYCESCYICEQNAIKITIIEDI